MRTFIVVMIMSFAGFISTAQNANDRTPIILESLDSSNVYYLYGNDGWGNVPDGWKEQQDFLEKATESDLEQTVLHSRTPAYRAMAYGALVSDRNEKCYDLLLSQLNNSSTFMLASGDVWYEYDVVSFMLEESFDSKAPLFTKRQQRHIDSLIVFSPGLEHLDQYASASRLKGMHGLYERLRKLHQSGAPNLLPLIAEYKREDDIPIMIVAIKEYKKGLDHEGASSKGPEGNTNNALNAMMVWNDDAFMPVLEELRDYELSREYIDYYRVKMLFKVVMSYDNEWAYNFIEETFGKLKGSEKYSYPENLFRAYYEEKEIPRFRPLVDKYGIKPYNWDIMQEILNIRSQHEQ